MNAHAASPLRRSTLDVFCAMLLVAVFAAIFWLAPEEQTMGPVQRIMYVHVAVAWCGLLCSIATAGAGALYLWRRTLVSDQWAQAAAEWGFLCCGLTLATGSLWAHEAWGVWWTWEPRLTSMCVLWTINCGYLLVRANLDEPHRRARVAAVIAILGALDVPLVVMATRWFRGMHPESPSMEPTMRGVLALTVVGFTFLSIGIVARRRGQLGRQSQHEFTEFAQLR